jgi:hypothetical protein
MLLCAEVQNVHIDAETGVVGEIVAGIVRIGIEDDVVRVPVPAVAIGDVSRSDAEEESAEAEAGGTSAAETPYLACPGGTRKVAMLPGVVEVVAGVIGGNVADPAIVAGIDVGGGGVTRLVRLATFGKRGMGGGAMGGNMSAANGRACGSDRRGACGRAGMSGGGGMSTSGMLGVCGEGDEQEGADGENCQRGDDFLHGFLREQQGRDEKRTAGASRRAGFLEGGIRGTPIIHAGVAAHAGGAAELCAGFIEEVPGDGDLGAKAFCNANGGGFQLLHQTGEVVAGAGDSGDAKGGGLPGGRIIHLGDGDIEAVSQFFFEAANDLAAVFERVSVFDAQLERHGGDGHRGFILSSGWQRVLRRREICGCFDAPRRTQDVQKTWAKTVLIGHLPPRSAASQGC